MESIKKGKKWSLIILLQRWEVKVKWFIEGMAGSGRRKQTLSGGPFKAIHIY